jgi:hypothetical protein
MPAGTPDFYVGVNLPWLTYGCDVGGNLWQPEGGVGRQERRDALEAILGRVSDAGLRHVRWFLMCDLRSGVRFDEHGTPSGLDAFVFRDLDAGIAAASRHGIALTLVLFDFLLCGRRQVVNGVALRGRRALVSSERRRGALVQRVVRPVLAHCAAAETVVAWDLFNEPEWATLGYGSLNPLVAVTPRTMRRFLGELSHAVRAETRQLVTVGLASHRGLPLLGDIDIDVYQVHWYDRQSRFIAPMVGGWKGKPLLLGEFPTRGSARSADEILEGARRGGYCGALGWSALAVDEYSELDRLERAARPPRSLS